VSSTFTLGVNYWPRKKAMYWWKDFDRAEVESEFAEIASLQLDVARIFLLWEDFQPAPDRVSEHALADLETVLHIAGAVGIKIMPTFFTGHMSGINWWPAWALTNEEGSTRSLCISGGEYTTRLGRDPYADPLMLDAERLLIGVVCRRYANHPAIYSWNFSNEPDIFFTPRRYQDGARWNEMLAREVRKHSPLPVSAGMHLPTLTAYNGFRPDLLAHVLGDPVARDRGAEVVGVQDRLLVDEVDHALELGLGADGQLDRHRAGAEPVANGVHGRIEVGADSVHLIDETDAGHVVAVRLAPDRLRLRLDPRDRVEDDDAAVENTEAPFHLDREIDMPRRVDDVDRVVLPRAGCRGGGDRNSALSLLFHPVHHRSSLMDLTDFIGPAGVEQNSLRNRRLSRVDMGNNANIADMFEILCSWHNQALSYQPLAFSTRACPTGAG